jgi:PIN domain nuclease of toxin-antitoxin system
VPFDAAQAVIAASMRKAMHVTDPLTGGISCLALAAKLGMPALTTERSWAKFKLDVKISIIRSVTMLASCTRR